MTELNKSDQNQRKISEQIWHASCYKQITMYTKALRYLKETTPDSLILKFELAGKTKENVKLTYTDGVLTIKIDEKNLYPIDLYDIYGWYEEYDAENVKASMKEGLLAVTIPKKKQIENQIPIE